MPKYVGELGWDSQDESSENEVDLATLLNSLHEEIQQTQIEVDTRRAKEDVRDSEIAFLENVVDRLIANTNVLVRNQGKLMAKINHYKRQQNEELLSSPWVYVFCLMFSILSTTFFFYVRCRNEPTLSICL